MRSLVVAAALLAAACAVGVGPAWSDAPDATLPIDAGLPYLDATRIDAGVPPAWHEQTGGGSGSAPGGVPASPRLQ
jgi:hypothetical protein